MASGFLSPLPWLGVSSATEQGGFRTPLPNWNAGTVAVAVQGGYVSVLAYWMGGAVSTGIEAPPTAVRRGKPQFIVNPGRLLVK